MKTREFDKLQPLLDKAVEILSKNIDLDVHVNTGKRYGEYARFDFESVSIRIKIFFDYGVYHARVFLYQEYKQKSWTPVTEKNDYSGFIEKIKDALDIEKISVSNESLEKKLIKDGNQVLAEAGLVEEDCYGRGDFKVRPKVFDGKQYGETSFDYNLRVFGLKSMREDQILSLINLILESRDGQVEVTLKFDASDLEKISGHVKNLRKK